MGSGKTTIGRMLAKKLERPFFDSDHEIEERTGARIADIFELEGEAGFRFREEKIIDELTQHEGIILATGGGAVLSERNRKILKSRGTVIYLCPTLNHLWRRVRYDQSRPLLQTENRRACLEALYKERDPLYKMCSHYTIATKHLNQLEVIAQILESMHKESMRTENINKENMRSHHNTNDDINNDTSKDTNSKANSNANSNVDNNVNNSTNLIKEIYE